MFAQAHDTHSIRLSITAGGTAVHFLFAVFLAVFFAAFLAVFFVAFAAFFAMIASFQSRQSTNA